MSALPASRTSDARSMRTAPPSIAPLRFVRIPCARTVSSMRRKPTSTAAVRFARPVPKASGATPGSIARRGCAPARSARRHRATMARRTATSPTSTAGDLVQGVRPAQLACWGPIAGAWFAHLRRVVRRPAAMVSATATSRMRIVVAPAVRARMGQVARKWKTARASSAHRDPVSLRGAAMVYVTG